MSPEQTGRIKKTADYRSDFYSLGVCLFELFTGDVPFICTNILEYFNSHVARSMPSICAINHKIPIKVAELITKLCEKNPEARYVSAWGVQHDIEQIAQHYERGENSDQLRLCQTDVRDYLPSITGVFGRDAELTYLREQLQVFQSGKQNLLVIAGPHGIGKSSLVEKFFAELDDEVGFIAEGRFYQGSQRPAVRSPQRSLKSYC